MIVNVDIVVPLCHEKILVPDVFLDNDHIREETDITVNWVTNGFECCHVGFLPLPYVPNAALFDKDDPSCANWAKWKKHNGFARAMVISKLNGDIVGKIKGMKLKEAPEKGDCLA